MYSERERIAHVVRRLGIGANTSRALRFNSVQEAITAMLDDTSTPPLPPIKTPQSYDDLDYQAIWKQLIPWWTTNLADGRAPLAERLTWFWLDHFAVSGHKVDNTFILADYHGLVRGNATGSFADLFHGVSTSAAMLWYLDGQENSIGSPNENFGREVMELHTLGSGNYTQNDVREIARACTGWVVNYPHWEGSGFEYPKAEPWQGWFDTSLHDPRQKTILGQTDRFDMRGALDLLLDQPETGRRVAGKLYKELVGLDPPPATSRRLGAKFSNNYDILDLVEEIVTDPAFVSDEAIRSRVRTPLEKAATLLQSLPRSDDWEPESLYWVLDKLNYLPLHPPNPSGFPEGVGLLDPARLLGAFEMLYMVENLDEDAAPNIDPLTALGLFDVSTETLQMLNRFSRPGLRLGLAFGSPEFQVV